jgi:hypothetical protein
MTDAFDANKDKIGAVSASLIGFKGCRAFSGWVGYRLQKTRPAVQVRIA